MYINLTLPNREGLIQALLNEFEWDFQSGKSHSITTGNCDHDEIAAEGTLEKGYYKNAAYVCSHCYPSSNPAMLEWTDKIVTLTVDEASSKPLRAMAVYYRIAQTNDFLFSDLGSGLDTFKKNFSSVS